MLEMYKYKPTWAICGKAFSDTTTTQQILMVFTDTLHWLYSYAKDNKIVFQRSEIIYDQFTIRFRYDISNEESNVVMDYLTTVCSTLRSFRKDARTKILVSNSEQNDNNILDVEFRIFFDLPF